MSSLGDLGNGSTAIGKDALQKQKTTIIGRDNTAFGHEALQNLGPNKNESTALGSQALTDNVNGENTAGGAYALARVSGTKNAGFGNWALRFVEGGDENTALGYRSMAGDENTDNNPLTESNGKRNAAMGSGSMRYSPDGSENTAIGHHSMYSINNNASNNTAAGAYSLANVKYVPSTPNSGQGNTAVGDRAGVNIRKGSYNTLEGQYAGSEIRSGNTNTLIGTHTGDKITSGSSNTMLGANANVGNDINAKNGMYRGAIGADSIVEQDNSIILGTIEDRVGIRTTKPTSVLNIVTNDIIDIGIKATTAGDGNAIEAYTNGANTGIGPNAGKFEGNAIRAETLTDISAYAYPSNIASAIKANTLGPKTGHAISAYTNSNYGYGINTSTSVTSTSIVANSTSSGNCIDVNIKPTSTGTGIEVTGEGTGDRIDVFADTNNVGIRTTIGSTTSFPIGFLGVGAIETSNQSNQPDTVAALIYADSQSTAPGLRAITFSTSVTSDAIKTETLGTAGNGLFASSNSTIAAIKTTSSNFPSGHAMEAITDGGGNAVRASTSGTIGSSAAIITTTPSGNGGPAMYSETSSTNVFGGPAIRAVTNSSVNYAIETSTSTSRSGIHATSTAGSYAIDVDASPLGSGSTGCGIHTVTSTQPHGLRALTNGGLGNGIVATNFITSQSASLKALTTTTFGTENSAIYASNGSFTTAPIMRVMNQSSNPSAHGILVDDSVGTKTDLVHSVAQGNGYSAALIHNDISTQAPGVALKVNGGYRPKASFVSSTFYNAKSNDYYIIGNPTGADINVLLLNAFSNPFSIFTVRNVSTAFNVFVVAVGISRIIPFGNASTSPVVFEVLGFGDSHTYINFGSDWYRII